MTWNKQDQFAQASGNIVQAGRDQTQINISISFSIVLIFAILGFLIFTGKLPRFIGLWASPSLTYGMSYEKAREMLIASGWQPTITNPMYKEALQQDLQEWFLERGFTEVEHCMPTSWGLCTAIFHDGNGQILSLTTSSGAYPDKHSVTVQGWNVEQKD